ncbi:MAG TPA: sensor domain-containing protein [Gammaproteobacteria bacterium]|nr:sensor domain-containing protein [Gammaproteobacteria bacterium]
MTKPVPRSVQEYLDQLRAELAGADPALIQDALYDAEEYLRGELHEHPEKTEEQVLAAIATTYGAPEEVAEAYRATEVKVQQALRTPRPKKSESLLGKFFGVFKDPRAYTALFYMLLSLATGIFYFVWTVTGMALSIGFMVLIVGIPFLLLYLGSIRLLSLVEGRLVEVLLGVRMPRRPVHPGDVDSRTLKQRIKEMFTDPRTWSTILYVFLKLPLGVIYFSIAVALLSASLGMISAPIQDLFPHMGLLWIQYDDQPAYVMPWILTPLVSALGVVLLTCLMHIARGVAYFHGHLAKSLLVKA